MVAPLRKSICVAHCEYVLPCTKANDNLTWVGISTKKLFFSTEGEIEMWLGVPWLIWLCPREKNVGTYLFLRNLYYQNC